MATEDLLVGRTLEGRYRILDRIARGGMSTVYSAVDERLDRLVAVKVMSSTLSDDPAFTDRFSREARAAARLTHLNTVAVYDQGADSSPDGHHVFLVMELVRGRTLRDLIRERGAFTPAEALSLMQPVLSALSAAHAAGIVHRDVKPENILLSDDGVLKVADFGLARAVESDASSTRTGLMMGTVAYCAPEQITRGQADPRSDVYAAGILLFELLTGKPPFQGDSAIAVAYQHVNSRVPAPSSRVRGIASEIDELVVLATDPDPAERPADAAEFLAQVSDVRTALRLPAVPIPTRASSGQHRVPARRPGADPGATDVLGARGGSTRDTQVVGRRSGPSSASWRGHDTAPATGGGPPPPVVTPPPRRRTRTARQRRRRRGLIALLVVVLLGLGAGVGGWWLSSGRYSRVPDLAGSSKTTAQQDLRDAGFKLGGTAGSRYSEGVPAGHVITTKPAAGSRHVHGTRIMLVLSLGPLRIPVPDVRRMTPTAADSAIAAQGLTASPTIEHKHNVSIEKGKVINTLPRAGQSIKKDQPVTLYVSLGPPKITVPTIAKGTSYQDAVNTLRNAHFKPARGPSEYDDIAPEGTVVSVSPTGRVTEFSQITITVSKGPQLVAVPDIANGTPLDEATQTLKDAQLKVSVHKVYGGFLDRVVGMNPPAGTMVPVGSTVTLTVV